MSIVEAEKDVLKKVIHKAISTHIEATRANMVTKDLKQSVDVVDQAIDDFALAITNEALGNTSVPEDIEHRAVNAARLKVDRHRFEKVFADEWADRNDSCLDCPDKNGTLDYILSENADQIPATRSQRDATVAASVVQWLGSEVGFDFILEVMHRALLLEGPSLQVINGLCALTKRLMTTSPKCGEVLVFRIEQEMKFFL